jgi:hypothetical protein
MDDNNKPNGLKGLRAVPMQGAPPNKRKTGLTREMQKVIGSQLQVTYNEVVNQGVPDRFVEFLKQLESGNVPNPGSDVQDEKGEGIKDAGNKGS